MKNFINFEWNTAGYVLLGIEYIEGEAESMRSGDVTPCVMLSIGFLFFTISVTFV